MEICFLCYKYKISCLRSIFDYGYKKKLIYMYREWEKEEIKNCFYNIYYGINRK